MSSSEMSASATEPATARGAEEAAAARPASAGGAAAPVSPQAASAAASAVAERPPGRHRHAEDHRPAAQRHLVAVDRPR